MKKKEFDSRTILIYLAVKYGGDPFKIITAVRNREDENVPYEEMESVCNNVKSNVITYLDAGLTTVIIRAIVAGFVTLGFLFRNTIVRTFKAIFKKLALIMIRYKYVEIK